MKFKAIALTTAAATALAIGGSAHAAATLVASYGFDNTLNSNVGGPALVAVDPTSSASFVTDTVNGVSRTVYQTAGSNFPVTSQGGLTFTDTSVINNTTGYSLEMSFEFTDGSRDNAWRRITDSDNRSSDTGFYDDPGNNLDVFPDAGSPSAFLGGVYRNVVLTVDTLNGHVNAYIDQEPVNLSLDTTLMNFDTINNPDDIIGLFLDNTQAGGQGEWSPVRISALNVYSGVLTSDQARAFAGDAIAGVPEPATWALMLLGFGGLGAMVRRRRAVAATA